MTRREIMRGGGWVWVCPSFWSRMQKTRLVSTSSSIPPSPFRSRQSSSSSSPKSAKDDDGTSPRTSKAPPPGSTPQPRQHPPPVPRPRKTRLDMTFFMWNMPIDVARDMAMSASGLLACDLRQYLRYSRARARSCLVMSEHTSDDQPSKSSRPSRLLSISMPVQASCRPCRIILTLERSSICSMMRLSSKAISSASSSMVHSRDTGILCVFLSRCRSTSMDCFSTMSFCSSCSVLARAGTERT